MNGKRNGEAGEAFEKSGEEDENKRLMEYSALNSAPEIGAWSTISASSSSSSMVSARKPNVCSAESSGLVSWVSMGFAGVFGDFVSLLQPPNEVFPASNW